MAKRSDHASYLPLDVAEALKMLRRRLDNLRRPWPGEGKEPHPSPSPAKLERGGGKKGKNGKKN